MKLTLIAAISLLQGCMPDNDSGNTNNSLPQVDHLVGNWQFENNFYDAVTHNIINLPNNDGVLKTETGVTFTTARKVGTYAAQFGGPSNPGIVYVDTPVNIPANGYTLAAWIYPTAANRGGIMGYGNWGSSYGCNELRMGDLDDEIVNYWWADDIDIRTGYSLLNAWHHVVATYDSLTRKKAIYVDGALVQSTVDNPNPITIDPNATVNFAQTNFEIGTSFPGSGQELFEGSIDDVAVWDTALSAEEILALYNMQK